MNVRVLCVALTILASALWAVFGVHHVAMVVVIGVSPRGLVFGTADLDAPAPAICFHGRARRLGDGAVDATGLVVLVLASLVLVVLSAMLFE